jgi:transcriptional regulator with XRE-family HTH domain
MEAVRGCEAERAGLREALGISQELLEERARTAYLGQLERGDRPLREWEVAGLAKALGVAPAELTGEPG